SDERLARGQRPRDKGRPRAGAKGVGIAEAVAYLVRRGHSAADLLDSSFDRIQFFFEEAQREEAVARLREDSRFMAMTRLANFSIFDKEALAAYKQSQRDLEKLLGDLEPKTDQQPEQAAMALMDALKGQ